MLDTGSNEEMSAPLLDKSKTVVSTGSAMTYVADDRHRKGHLFSSAEFLEVTFHYMQVRKTTRQRHGIYEANRPWKTLWAFLTLLLLLGLFAPSFTNGKFEFDFHLNVREIGFFSLAALLMGITLVYTFTRAIVVVRWALYWVLLTEAVLYFWKREVNLFSENTPWILQVSFVFTEFMTFAIYALIHYFYPAFIESSLFHKIVGTKKFWRVSNIGACTYTYKSGALFTERYTCSYRGAVNAKGLPHGYGHWMDDHYHGEILTGWWQNGLPVGPFRSREYGSGFAFDNWMVGFVQAHDDGFSNSSCFPAHEKPMTIGVASVECSVSGSFFSHLPDATPAFGPRVLVHAPTANDQHYTVAETLERIRHLSIEHPLSKVLISTDASHGVAIAGHVHADNRGQQCDQIVIDIVRPEGQNRITSSMSVSIPRATADDPLATAPSPSTPALRSSLVLPNYLENEFTFESPVVAPSTVNSYGAVEEGNVEEPPAVLFDNTSGQGPIKGGFDSSQGHFQPFTEATLSGDPYLRVRGWNSCVDGHSEVLVFFPGFNAHLSTSLKRIGQFMAIGHFPPYIKPFVFSAIGGRVSTYLWSVESAASDIVQQRLQEFLQGLLDAGVRNVHFMCHSMGVQTLMAAFADRPNGDFSPVSSLCQSSAQEDRSDKLRVRTISLINSDYPLASFVDKGFKTLRRVCDNITVVGNRKDAALLWSELGNGTMYTLNHYLQYKSHPDSMRVEREEEEVPGCNSNLDSCWSWINCCCCNRKKTQDEIQGYDRLWSKQLTVGRQIYSLFAPKRSLQDAAARRTSDRFNYNIQERRQRNARQWLDLDAIDTTLMEQNVHLIRHNYFNLNPVLLEDLRELIVTGRRASERSLLLHREGNIYSYCQAPTCVVNN